MGKRKTTEEFISDAAALYGDTYDYSKVVYTQNKVKVPIICRIHGEFSQSPNAHLRGAGCPSCANTAKTIPLEEQIRRANIIHQSKYDYSLIDPTTYKGSKRKVSIICPHHGVFTQNFGRHIRRGDGCRFCSSSKFEIKLAGYLNLRNIKYKREKTFPDLKNNLTGMSLRYDFYLPEAEILCESRGIQHFFPTSFGSDRSEETMKKNLEVIKYRDQLKIDYALKNNIKLLVISYKDIDNLTQILDYHLGIDTSIIPYTSQDTISYDSNQAVKQAA